MGPELFRETARRIPRAHLLLLEGKGQAAAGTSSAAMRKIVGF